MKILYISTLCAKETYREMFGYNTASPNFAVQKYHSVMTKGLSENGAEVICVTSPPVPRKSKSGLYVNVGEKEENGTKFRYIPFLNLPVIKNLSVYQNTKKACYRLLKNSFESGETAGLVLDLLCISSCAGALSGLRKFNKKHKANFKSAGIVTDLPDYLAHGGGLLEKAFNKSFNSSLEKCSSYVLLTEQMNELLNKAGKPYAIIEGQADESTPLPSVKADNPMEIICMYAGSLARIYGIMTLAEAFKELYEENKDDEKIAKARLHIYGNGECREELIKMSEATPAVKYCGVLSPDEIVAKEQGATLLINPRPAGEEYTKYSFPSKNMEYMASGTAVLTTDLPGMPEEYNKYVYIINDESISGIKNTLKELLTSDISELRNKGLAARDFVLNNKSGKIQAGKVLELLR
ncbi:MAG: glycosyltransferase [Clostridia bacterium]|nr:glycosyltransferase [Clostridia bacterium]